MADLRDENMTNTHKQRRIGGREEAPETEGQVEYEGLRLGSNTRASCEDFESLSEVIQGVIWLIIVTKDSIGNKNMYMTTVHDNYSRPANMSSIAK